MGMQGRRCRSQDELTNDRLKTAEDTGALFWLDDGPLFKNKLQR